MILSVDDVHVVEKIIVRLEGLGYVVLEVKLFMQKHVKVIVNVHEYDYVIHDQIQLRIKNVVIYDDRVVLVEHALVRRPVAMIAIMNASHPTMLVHLHNQIQNLLLVNVLVENKKDVVREALMWECVLYLPDSVWLVYGDRVAML